MIENHNLMKPIEIKLISEKALQISWDDGHKSIYFAGYMRLNCPCALCEKLQLRTNRELFKNLDNIQFNKWEQSGNYAVKVWFSDGHSTGIYRYELLREICQCDACEGNTFRICGPFS